MGTASPTNHPPAPTPPISRSWQLGRHEAALAHAREAVAILQARKRVAEGSGTGIIFGWTGGWFDGWVDGWVVVIGDKF